MATAPRTTQQTFEPWTDPDAKPYVRIEKVTKKFGDFFAVDDLTLDIYQKEIFCLLGPSGCGKTTLLLFLVLPIMYLDHAQIEAAGDGEPN